MLVTKITPQKRDATKYNIFLDGTYAFALSAQDIAYFKIKEFEQVSEETVAYIREELLYIRAQDAALHFIGYKMRTVQEVTQKLAEQGVDETVIARVLRFLAEYGYTDDWAYAEKYIRERQRLSPRSSYALAIELRQRGVAEEICRKVLAEHPVDEETDAFCWLEKKLRGEWPPDEKKRRQVIGFLQRKGYSYDKIKEAFRRMEQQRGDGM